MWSVYHDTVYGYESGCADRLYDGITVTSVSDSGFTIDGNSVPSAVLLKVINIDFDVFKTIAPLL